MDFVAVIARESAALASAARRPGALERAVPACPGWTVADLVRHIGTVQRFWTAAVRASGGRPDGLPPPELAGGELLAWYDEMHADFLAALRAADPAATYWAWWADSGETLAGLARRQAHEVAVHRWDTQSALGRADPLEPAMAADGVAEFCERMLGPWEDATWTGPTGVLRLAAGDTGDGWSVRLAAPYPRLVDVVPADATVSGDAADLDLWLWRRGEEVVIAGESDLVTAFRAWGRLD